MIYVFSILFLASIAGIIYPYLQRFRRKHFAIAAVGAFVGMMVTVPDPTPEQLAARAAEDHKGVLAKTRDALAQPAEYTRADYAQTYTRVGAKTFALLGKLEPGAAYTAAESDACDKVTSLAVSDTSKPDKAVWFVDCANENRFMVSQQAAEAALVRFGKAALVKSDLKPSCTLSSAAKCKATGTGTATAEQPTSPAEEAAKAKEIEFVSACDMILQQALVSPSSLDMSWKWAVEVAGKNTVVIRRNFDSQNSFGAMIRSQYVCKINATTTNIEGFTVNGPTGSKKVI